MFCTDLMMSVQSSRETMVVQGEASESDDSETEGGLLTHSQVIIALDVTNECIVIIVGYYSSRKVFP